MGTSQEKSLANRYLVMLAEATNKTEMNGEKLYITFKMFDEIIDHLGVFKEVVMLIKNYLIESSFSKVVTADDWFAKKDESNAAYLHRVPYFELNTRLQTNHNHILSRTTTELNLLIDRFKQKEGECNQLTEKVDTKDNEVDNLLSEIAKMKEQMRQNEREHARQDSANKQTIESMQSKIDTLTLDIQDLKSGLNDVSRERDSLLPYKQLYDKMDRDFQQSPENSILFHDSKLYSTDSTRRAHLIKDIRSALKMENQLLQAQNSSIEEFETVLDRHRSQVNIPPVSLVNTDSKLNAADQRASRKQHPDPAVRRAPPHHHLLEQLDSDRTNLYESDRADLELLRRQTEFRQLSDQLEMELAQLREHAGLLMEQLLQMEESLANPKQLEESRKLLNSMIDGKNDMYNEILFTDPFVVHERVFSKYSAMIQVSVNNGKTYFDLKEGRLCCACGEKTVICPHQKAKNDVSIKLPVNTSHMKIIRPKVNINHRLFERVMTDDKSVGGGGGVGVVYQSSSTPPPPTHHHHHHLNNSLSGIQPRLDKRLTTIGESSSSQVTGAMSPAAGSGSLVIAQHNMQQQQPVLSRSTSEARSSRVDWRFKYPPEKLWRDYERRSELDRKYPRYLSFERVMKISFEFWASVLLEDEYTNQEDEEEESHNSTLDKLYYFFLDRYLREEMGLLAIHDFLAALSKYSADSQLLYIFQHVLLNNLDGCAFRYLLLLMQFVDTIEWRSSQEFSAYVNVIYLFLSEDDAETFRLAFLSYCENKMSKKVLAEFLLYNFIKCSEPRFVEFESMLTQYCAVSAVESGLMSWREFQTCLEANLPTFSEKLARRLFYESIEANCQDVEYDHEEELEQQQSEQHAAMSAADREKHNFRLEEKMIQFREKAPISKLAYVMSYLSLLQLANNCGNQLIMKIAQLREIQNFPTESNVIDQMIESRDETIESIVGQNVCLKFKSREQLLNEEKTRLDDPSYWSMERIKNLSLNISRSSHHRQQLVIEMGGDLSID